MTLHEINQRPDYLESQLDEMGDFDVSCIIIQNLYNDAKIKENHKHMMERITILRTIITEAQNQDGSMGGQEQTNIEVQINDEKSDEQSHQFIESVETENYVDDLLQAKQQQKPQHSTVEDSPIKMVDIYAMKEKIKKSVISEIEGQIIELDVDIKYHMITLDQEQTYIDSIMKVDTFRGGTEINLFNFSTIEVQMSDTKTMKTIMFGAQTAKQYQSNGQKYQDDMNDNPKSDAKIKSKTQESVRLQIEEDKVIEAYVTHWQEQENYIRVQQRQEREMQDYNVPEHDKFIGGEDHNFRHGVEKRKDNYAMISTRPSASRLAGV
jgi:hypothetical protein